MSKKSRSNFHGFDEEKARGWYQNWREKIYDWVKSHTDSDLADIILFLPDLFVLSMGLILDARVPSKLKVALVSAVAYVLSPFDLIPEALLGVAGLIDDAGILIIALHTVFGALELTPDEVEQILRDYWHGHGHPVEIVVKLYNMISKGANQLFAKLRKWQKHSRQSNSIAGDETVATGAVAIT